MYHVDRSCLHNHECPRVLKDPQTHATENHELEPDIRVPDDYNKLLSGEDQQLEAAVKEMLGVIK